MAEYRYSAIGRDGRELQGNLSADSEEALTEALKARKLILLKARKVRLGGASVAIALGFTSELSRLVGAGIVLDRALEIVAEDAPDPRLGALCASLRQAIKRGEALSVAMADSGRFDALAVAVVRAGEASGELAAVLALLEQHYEDGSRLKRDLLAALAYPMILLFASILAVIGLAVYVIPTFRGIFEGQTTAIPLGTRVVFMVSDWVVSVGGYVLIGLAVGAVLFGVALKRGVALRFAVDRILLLLPIAGDMIAKIEAARFLKVLGLLLKGGVPLLNALDLSRAAFVNRAQSEGLARAITRLRKGVSLPAALEDVPAFPRLATRLLKVGNETGKLAETATRAGVLLGEEALVRLKTLVAILDPLLILGMGALIGSMVMAMLAGVFSLSDIR